MTAVLLLWTASAVYGLVDGARLLLSREARARRIERGRLHRLLGIDDPNELRKLGYLSISTGVVLVMFVVLVLLRT